jgi:hypothetical protein
MWCSIVHETRSMLLSCSVHIYYFTMLSNILLSRFTPYTDKLLGIISVDFDITNQLLITYSAFIKFFRSNGNTSEQYISHDCKKAEVSGREVFVKYSLSFHTRKVLRLHLCNSISHIAVSQCI